MHASTDALVNSVADQTEAEAAEARGLAPHNRFFMNDRRIRAMLEHALRGLDDSEAKCAVPVIRCGAAFGGPSTQHMRNGTSPIGTLAPVQYCNVCSNPVNCTVPFWVARGRYIVQVDMCGTCADEYVLIGAVPQADASE